MPHKATSTFFCKQTLLLHAHKLDTNPADLLISVTDICCLDFEPTFNQRASEGKPTTKTTMIISIGISYVSIGNTNLLLQNTLYPHIIQ